MRAPDSTTCWPASLYGEQCSSEAEAAPDRDRELLGNEQVMAEGVLHEDLRRDDDAVGPSDRKFGLTIGGVFALIAIWKAVTWSGWSFLWGGLAAAFIIFALAQPRLLAPLNRVWLKFGLLLHRIVSPIIMGILFYATILPIGLLMRALGKDPLRLKLEKGAGSYWLPRADDRPTETSMRQQF